MTADGIRTHARNESRTYKVLKSWQSLSGEKALNHSATAVEFWIRRIHILMRIKLNKESHFALLHFGLRCSLCKLGIMTDACDKFDILPYRIYRYGTLCKSSTHCSFKQFCSSSCIILQITCWLKPN